ncbi:MAG TPA: UDP-N-acetylglucosamine--LPS N-acetylglucosamine transferase [Nocardioides sp.]|uniref:UDP-N-acetylglucosamine--LPS N-acetylglucosamine transferase n=1 Tax=Nocardioides sp. TaxID=35761 RepID=UPI002B981563|nr:UDP-N-acetylglucosamine--LPS N-acetylglucosamine transferase [Nocardioides sp.]HQR28133.1 UDP-N-acetylglucosamine--LPS N-acetylglucosamine transferase [Nocardioides sp.]
MAMWKRRQRTSRDVVRPLLVGSSGGHLTQLFALRSWWESGERGWVTFDTPDAIYTLADEKNVWWAFHPTTRNIPNLLRNTRLAWRVLREFRPTVVVSTGAGTAVPFFVLGRLLGARTAYVEVYDRVETATLTGRLCRPFTDVMMVQWPEQAALYDDAVVIGPLL